MSVDKLAAFLTQAFKFFYRRKPNNLIFLTMINVSLLVIGNLANHDGDSNENDGHQTKGLMSRTMVLHVFDSF